MYAGGRALAEKLLKTYLMFFKLILEGKLDHAEQLSSWQQPRSRKLLCLTRIWRVPGWAAAESYQFRAVMSLK